MKELRIITGQNNAYNSDNIHGNGDVFIDTGSIFSVNEIKREINTTINNIVEMIDVDGLNQKGFDVSEMTFNLNINSEGKVSLLSCLSGGVSTQSGITIKIIRRAI